MLKLTGEEGSMSIKMTEETVKEFIKSYSELKAKRDVIEKIQKYSQNENKDSDKEYSELVIKIEIIESALKLLSKHEKTIILLHLVDDIKWKEVMSIYEQQVGTEFNYSERSFLRIQKNALKKIGNFLLENGFEQYID